MPNIREKLRLLYKRKLLFIGAVLFSGLLLFFGFIGFSATPTFCKSCHVMKSYYKDWQLSKHNHVSCVKCHYPPGFENVVKGKIQAMKQVVAYFTKTYSTRFYAEIEDASCLRSGCHTKQKLDTVVLFKQNIHFNHKHHLETMKRGKRLRCASCHSQLVVGEHIAVTEKVCFLCHFKDRVDGVHPQGQTFCTQCHKSPPQDIEIGDVTYNHKDYVDRGVPCQSCHLEAVRGTGEVTKDRCNSCHVETERLARFNDGEFMHLHHVTNRKVECDRCHDEIVHSVKTTTLPLDYNCSVCHASMHSAIKDLYMGKGGKGVPDAPSHMFKVQVDCIACHVSEEFTKSVARFKGQTFRPSEKGCIKCHTDDVQGMLEEWKTTVNDELAQTLSLISRAESKAKGPGVKAETRRLFDEARYNYDFVKYGKGIHNIEYASSLLAHARKNLTQIIEGR